MNKPSLISFEKAAVRLHVSESDLDDLIDAGALRTHPYLGDIFLDADEVAALARSREPKPIQDVNTPPPGIVGWSPIARIRDLKTSGVREVSSAQAAKLLKLSRVQIQSLLREGRLNGEKRGRYRWIDILEVEMYAMDQNHWSRLSGRWTSYCKQDVKDPSSGLQLLSEARVRDSNVRNSQFATRNDDDYLLLTRQAADVLGIGVGSFHNLIKKHGIQPVKIKPHHELADERFRPGPGNHNGYSACEIYAIAAARDAKQSRAGFSPKQWRDRAVRPFIRTKIEPPPNDMLITTAEAAAILGVCRARVSDLVGKGRLFGWQTHPGKRGCPLFLSANQVHRYANDPDRLDHRDRLSRGPRESSPPGRETELELWREDVGLTAGMDRAKRRTVDREHGEFFNTRQVAKLLGVATATVNRLRRASRLSGYQKKRRKVDGVGNKWWFYRKDDVYALLADGEYLRRHERGLRAAARALGRELPSMETEW